MKVSKRRRKVVGVDPSLTATGVALPGRELITIKKPTPNTYTDVYQRLISIRDELFGLLSPRLVVVMENYSHASKYQAHQLGELGGVLRTALLERSVPFYLVPPTKVRMFATGKGNASKESAGYAAVERFGLRPGNNNEADALWLWEFGNHLLGQPDLDLPKDHLRALAGVNGPIDRD